MTINRNFRISDVSDILAKYGKKVEGVEWISESYNKADETGDIYNALKLRIRVATGT